MSNDPTPSPPSSNSRLWAFAGGGILLGGLALLVALAIRMNRQPPEPPPPAPSGPPDPRLEYTGPLRNVRPDVAYVGDAACAGCHNHDKECASFRHHPMGRSLLPIAEMAPVQPYERINHNPFEVFGSRFWIERQGDRVRHRQERLDAHGQPVYEFATEVHYVMGSGNNGCAYLTERDGYLFQTAISWFSQKQIWDISPGFFGAGWLAGRPVPPACVFCHANQTKPVEGSLNRYERPIFRGLAIGCERCHGPGGLHVESADALDIVHPGKLEPTLREAVCEQCHLRGEARVVRRGRSVYDFRPGLPLSAFLSVFARASGAGDKSEAVNHVEQMHQSRCFQRTAGPRQMGCVSCHDPHVRVGPAERVAHYRARCLNCHKDGPECSVPEPERRRQQKDDSCIVCHMPRYEAADVVHTAATDHRIVRRPHKPTRPPEGVPLLVPFHGGPPTTDDPELARDLGLALAEVAFRGGNSATAAAAQAVPVLEMAVQRYPDDVEAWEAKGQMLALLGRNAEGLASFQMVLDREPNRELSLAEAARLAQNQQQPDTAIDYWQRAVKANPWMAHYRGNVARLLAYKGDWPAAQEQCQMALRLDPGSIEVRQLWVRCLLHGGRKDEARAEFARIERLAPPNLADLKAWFDRESP